MIDLSQKYKIIDFDYNHEPFLELIEIWKEVKRKDNVQDKNDLYEQKVNDSMDSRSQCGYFLLHIIVKTCSQDNIQQQWPQFSSKQAELHSQITIPRVLRNPFFKMYSWYYSANILQAQKPLHSYQSFSAFFTRKIKRQPEKTSQNTVVSPCDGKILSFTQIVADQCLIVKDRKYSLSELFLGQQYETIQKNIAQKVKRNKNTKLFQMIIYLSPGDYHRFHAPTNFHILIKKKIPGLKLSVSQKSILKHDKLYERNARVTLMGQWKQGFLGMSLVGAMNVSKIHVQDKDSFEKYQEIGYFNLGSTIVLVVQALAQQDWNVKVGERVKYGDPLMKTVQ